MQSTHGQQHAMPSASSSAAAADTDGGGVRSGVRATARRDGAAECAGRPPGMPG
eukprot:CAMPEP_0204575794 /NCGR_PEP_ID=MMETSP0661-20131031/41402_1 /ASSEMBLY_ACC=CAM_ASM_000606 /TAXON_ID=109239 /ORGANISM="Alexandrium margalefi, Strain AMGDE01CS-322" /LENGTH=53 /DNA_ID=CAMNT_0051584467 /DNA_START=103 /DNA_END=260 /DNA_ORIENTATION=-